MIARLASFRLIVAAVVATIAPFVAPGALAAEGRRIVVEIREFEFVPERPEVSPGDIVVWKNLDIVPHTATSGDGSWDSGLIEAEGTWEMLITDDMVLDYYCRFHPSMVAVLRLGPE